MRREEPRLVVALFGVVVEPDPLGQILDLPAVRVGTLFLSLLYLRAGRRPLGHDTVRLVHRLNQRVTVILRDLFHRRSIKDDAIAFDARDARPVHRRVTGRVIPACDENLRPLG